MSQNPIDRFEAGQPPPMSARRENLISEVLTDWVQRAARSGNSTFRDPQDDPTLILMRNDVGESRSQFDIVGIGAPIFGPNDNLSEFQQRPTFKLTNIAAKSEQYAVLQEPIRADGFGLAKVFGTTIARVSVGTATVTPPEYASTAGLVYFDGDTPGSIQILWREGITGQQWALVHLRAGSGQTPTCPAANAVWGISLIGLPAAGSQYRLGFGTLLPPTATWTSPIAANASPATVQTAIEAHPFVGTGNCVVIGATGGFNYQVTFQGSRAGMAINNFLMDIGPNGGSAGLLGHGVGGHVYLVSQGRAAS